MKKTIEIECPDGYKPVYDTKTGKVEIIPENIMDRIKTYEDAKNYLGVIISDSESISYLAKLQTILDALNEKHKFNLLTGTVWYPWVRFFRMKSVPKNAEIIGHFRYQGEKFALVGGSTAHVDLDGIGYFNSYIGVGAACPNIGMLACKSEEIAKYMSTQFGKLIFNACFSRHLKGGEFEWLD